MVRENSVLLLLGVVYLKSTIIHHLHDNKLFGSFALKKPFQGASHTMQLSTSDLIFNIMTANTDADQHRNGC